MILFGYFLGSLSLFACLLGTLLTGAHFFPRTQFGLICLALLPHAFVVRYLGQSASTSFAPSESDSPPSRPSTPTEVLEQAEKGAVIEVGGTSLIVRASACLHELRIYEGSDEWTHIDPHSNQPLGEWRALLLPGGDLIVQHPTQESGTLAYFRYQQSETPMGFGEYLEGTVAKPGPAVRFADSRQQDNITFEAAGRTWQILDLMWVDVCDVKGPFFAGKSKRGASARLCFVLGRDGEDYILYAGHRSGQGADTLWIGQRFNAEVEVDV